MTTPRARSGNAAVAPSRGTTDAPLGLSRAVGIIGELLIAAGVLVALYVVWQLFYTDIQADQSHQRVLEDLTWAQPAVAAGSGPDVETIPEELQFTDVAPPVVGGVDHASTFGALFVPRWGTDYAKPISEGVSRRDVLDTLGIGHYPDTAMPGELGNFAVAGHRTTYGKPFSDVDTLEVGDSLIVQTEDAWYVYRVIDWSIVSPTAVDTIAPVPGQADAEPDGHYITLTTCHPRYSAAQRWVVHGVLDYWAPTGHGVPPEMLEEFA